MPRQPSATARDTRPPPGRAPLAVGQHVLAARPAGGLVEQRVLVEVDVVGEAVGRRVVAEQRLDRGLEHLAEVEVDRAHGAVEVDRLVEQQARAQEALQRRDARLVQRQPALGDERVAAQPFRRRSRPARP